MFEELLISRTTKVLSKGIDAASLRQQVIANNIANVDTPGFKRSDIVFASELQNAVRRLDQAVKGNVVLEGSDPVDGVSPRVVQERSTSYRPDGNNVDIDVEMAELAQNTIWYNAMIQQISQRFSTIRTAINEGRR